MIRRQALRALREGRIRESMAHGTDLPGYRRGSMAFLREFHQTLGVDIDTRGRPIIPLDERGLPHRPQAAARADEVSIRDLAEAIMGHERVEDLYHPASGFDFGGPGASHLLEAALDPTAIIDVSLFNLGVAGLVNAQIIERFNAPEYVGRELVTIKPTNMNGHKRIGVSKISPVGKAAKGRQPGEMHAEVGFGEMYQLTAETIEQALKCILTREIVYFDYTGQVTETAGQIGDELAYGQDKDIADTVMGVTGLPSRYNLNGTTYETYQSASPYVNKQSNQFQDITSVDKARQQIVGATDPITGREIQINTLDILCFPFQELRMRHGLFGPNVQIGTQQSAGNFPTFYTQTANALSAVGRGTYRLIPLTAIWRNRALAADGLALAGNVADLYWWLGDFKRAFEWQENWGMTPWQAPADELTMKDRGLVAVFGCNYRGSMQTLEPRFAYEQTN